MSAAPLMPGYADPVHDAQRAFRRILAAMSAPGSIHELDGTSARPPLGAAAAAVALTLCDPETPVWLAPALDGVRAWLAFHCGAPAAASPGAARFAFADPAALPSLAAFDLGTDAFPDRSTTLVLEVTDLRAGGGLVLTGPGIERTTRLDVAGPSPRFWTEWSGLAELFPRGLDLILTCGPHVAALPRTTRIASTEASCTSR